MPTTHQHTPPHQTRSSIGLPTVPSIPFPNPFLLPGSSTLAPIYFGKKRYELNDWLGNVRVVINDKKTPVNSGSVTISYKPQIMSVSDYYSFGSQISERSYDPVKPLYRFGFNTQEKVNEITPDHYTAKFWEYDSRLGRRWNVDPKPTVGESEYAVNKNNPVQNNDPEGDCPNCPKPQVSGNLFVSIGNKSASFSFGLSAGIQYQQGSMMLGLQGSMRTYLGGLGSTGMNDGQIDLVLSGSATLGKGSASPMALNTFNSLTPSSLTNSFASSITFASNLVFNSSGHNQRVGSLGFRAGDVTGNLYNDFFPILGDQDDRWWTGGFTGEIKFGNRNSVFFGSEAFTGERKLANTEINFISGNRQGKTSYLIDQIGNRAYYKSTTPFYNNGQTFFQLNTSSGLMFRANIIGGKNSLWQQNVIHDNYPGKPPKHGPIPRFVPSSSIDVQGISGFSIN